MIQENLSALPRESAAVNEIFEDLRRRLKADGGSQCPVETCYAAVTLCLSQSCGKCTPCRVGLARLKDLLDLVLNGEAAEEDLALIEETARVMSVSSDCAIGFEAGRTVLNLVACFRDEFLSHIHNQGCLKSYQNPVPCLAYCPAHVNIPAYIRLVAAGRYDDAVKVIREDNPFPSACALVCEHPCEAHCRRITVDDAVNVRGLKRMAVDNAMADEAPEKAEATGKKVAVVGAGPSGLTAAYFLARMGHEVTVYEQRREAGGMLRYGIPAYRLPRRILDRDIDYIKSAGVKVLTDVSIGKDVSFDELKTNYDALYLSIGAHSDNKLGIEGEDAEGVFSAVELLRGIGDGQYPDFTGKKVVVVGGGNVAMDCTRSAMRLGAESVTCVYRRRKEDMTAQVEEIEGAVEEGCRIATLLAPDRIEKDENGRVTGLWVRPQLISLVKGGRPGVVDAAEEKQLLPADIVLVAIGQKIDSAYFEKNGIPANRGRILADKTAKVTGSDGIFAGGDCATGPATAIKAIAAGKVAACSIDRYLGYHHEIVSEVDVPGPTGLIAPACGRVNLAERAPEDRKRDFDLMECPMTKEQAAQEASRCLNCDCYGFAAFRKE